MAYAPEYIPVQRQEIQITTLAAISGVNPLIAADEDKATYIASGIPMFAGGLHRTSATLSKMGDCQTKLVFTMTNLRSLYISSVTYAIALVQELLPSIDTATVITDARASQIIRALW